VAIVGSGYTGLAAALYLARSGATVAVFEANSIGWGASSRNGGMVLTGLKLPLSVLFARYGRELARRMYSSSLAALDLVERIVEGEAIECNFRRWGHLEVAAKASHFDSYAQSAELIQKEFGHNLEIISAGELGREISSAIYFGGLLDPTSAGLNPARYVAGLARAALRAGASIYENTQVERIERHAENGSAGFRLVTSRGTVFAREVLVATSGYTSRATPQLAKRVIPIGSFIIATEPLSEDVACELIPRGRMIFDSKHYLHYYRLTQDNRLLFGGRAAFFPETRSTIRQSARILAREMIRIFPWLKEKPIEHAWGGTLDFCFDTLPHAGALDGIHYAVGYAGHGVAMATYLGTKVAEKISGHAVDLPYAEIPFPGAPLGLYNGRPWFLPLAGAYYKLLDWIS
jgi:glycine/D-amino acid oxidase-like deaminating enzyme